MKKGKINIVFSKDAPNKNMLWCYPNSDAKTCELKFYGANGWENISDVALENIVDDLVNNSVAFAEYDSSTHTISLANAAGDTVATIDATEFIKDGMINSAEYTTTDADGNTGAFVHLVFNTDAGKDDIYVDLSDLIDTNTTYSLTLNDNILTLTESTGNSYSVDITPVLEQLSLSYDEDTTVLSLNYTNSNEEETTISSVTLGGSVNSDAYGIEWYTNQSDPTCTRVGNMVYHRTLPIQSKMANCIIIDKEVQYWLHPDHSMFKAEYPDDEQYTVISSDYAGEEGYEGFYISSYDAMETPSDEETADWAINTSLGVQLLYPAVFGSLETYYEDFINVHITGQISASYTLWRILMAMGSDHQGEYTNLVVGEDEDGNSINDSTFEHNGWPIAFIDSDGNLAAYGVIHYIDSTLSFTARVPNELTSTINSIDAYFLATDSSVIDTIMSNPDDYKLVFGAALNGYDGEIATYIPTFYYRSWSDDYVRRVMISEKQIDSSWVKSPAMFVKSFGVSNMRPYYTANNCSITAFTDANGDTDNALGWRGRYYVDGSDPAPYTYKAIIDHFSGWMYGSDTPATARNYTIDLVFNSNSRQCYYERDTDGSYSPTENSQEVTYKAYKAIVWLWYIEYATFYSQDSFNSELTADGYHQGGSGAMLSIINVSTMQSACNTLSFIGNGTGILYCPEFTYRNSSSFGTIKSWGGLNGSWTYTLYTVSTDDTDMTDLGFSTSLTYYKVTAIANTGYSYGLYRILCGGSAVFEVYSPNSYDGYIYFGDASGEYYGSIDMSTGFDSVQSIEVTFEPTDNYLRIWTDFTSDDCEIYIGISSTGSSRNSAYESFDPTGSYILSAQGSFNYYRWRGIDHPFGLLFWNLNGFNIVEESTAKYSYYICDDRESYSNDSTDGYTKIYEDSSSLSTGWIKEFYIGETAELIPISVGGGAATYKTDYFSRASSSSVPFFRCCSFGGFYYNGSLSGFGSVTANSAVSAANNAGARYVVILDD